MSWTMSWAIIECPCCGSRMELGKHISMQTNADRIRSMSDEELAEWFYSVCTASSECSCSDCKFYELECAFEKWLGQECE